MEKNRYDQDEMLILNALKSVQTQDFNMMKEIEEKMKKTKRPIKKGVILAIAAVLLLGTTAFATQYLGGFDRLRDIVGETYAENLTPIEIATDDADQEIIYDGIRVELVAVNVEGNAVDVYFTLEDTTGNRLSNGFRVENTLVPTDDDFPMDAWTGSYRGTEVIHTDENGIVTMHASHEFGVNVEGMELTFHLWEIMFDVQDEQHASVAVNLANFLNNSDYIIYQYENPNPWGTAIQTLNVDSWEMAESIRSSYEESIRTEGIPVLVPGNADISLASFFDFADARASISSIGVIDGRLHIQVYHPERRVLEEAGWEGFSRLSLFHGSLEELNLLRAERQAYFDAGYEIWEINAYELWNGTRNADMTVWFYIDANGETFFHNPLGIGEDGHAYTINDPRVIGSSRFDEHIFDIDFDTLHEYVLIAHTFSYQTLPVQWNITFTVE
ncbi:MAG: hypothetical protein FWE05_02690 [Defluviitaleaceae bacterium]|nr:hypothetical protein [Defluviitaleaceae bacterium]